MADVKQINGVWKFKNTLNIPSGGFQISQNVNFTVYTTPQEAGVECVFTGIAITVGGKDESVSGSVDYVDYQVASVTPDDWMAHWNITFPSLFSVYIETAWSLEIMGEGIQSIDFGTKSQDVSTEFYNWLIENAQPISATVVYKGNILESITGGEYATLHTKGKVMEDDIRVHAVWTLGGAGVAQPVFQEKTITENGEYTADSGYDGIGKVIVDVPIPDGYIKPSGTKSITENGTHDVTNYASVSVNVPGEVVEIYDGTVIIT